MTPFSIVLVWTIGENALKSTRFQLVWTSENGKQTLAWTKIFCHFLALRKQKLLKMHKLMERSIEVVFITFFFPFFVVTYLTRKKNFASFLFFPNLVTPFRVVLSPFYFFGIFEKSIANVITVQ